MLNSCIQQFERCCGEPLPVAARKGIDLFNRGHFFACHEALEEAWRAADGPCRLLYQSLLQLGVALHHLQQGNMIGAQKVQERALKKLDQLPDVCQGVLLADLKRRARELSDILKEEGADGIMPFPRIRVQEPGASR